MLLQVLMIKNIFLKLKQNGWEASEVVGVFSLERTQNILLDAETASSLQ